MLATEQDLICGIVVQDVNLITGWSVRSGVSQSKSSWMMNSIVCLPVPALAVPMTFWEASSENSYASVRVYQESIQLSGASWRSGKGCSRVRFRLRRRRMWRHWAL